MAAGCVEYDEVMVVQGDKRAAWRAGGAVVEKDGADDRNEGIYLWASGRDRMRWDTSEQDRTRQDELHATRAGLVHEGAGHKMAPLEQRARDDDSAGRVRLGWVGMGWVGMGRAGQGRGKRGWDGMSMHAG